MPERLPKRPSPGARLAAAARRAAAAAAERPERTFEAPRGVLAARSRRDFLLLGAGLVATAAAGWWLLPERAKRTWLPGAADRLDTLAARVGLTRMQREAQLNRVLTFDDDVAEALAMMRYYLGVIPHALARKPWPHPPIAGKYNALQRGAYFTMPLVGALVVLSGWAMHKPATLGWLERLFVSYDVARIVHFTCLVILGGFTIPHVLLAIADGWDTVRGMVTGWSTRLKGAPHA